MNTNKKRRAFLQGVGVVSAAVSVPSTAAVMLQAVADRVQRAEFPTPDFESFSGQTVKIKLSDDSFVDAVIEEVQELSFQSKIHFRPAHVRSCAKIVRFKLGNVKSIKNDVYGISHPSLGELDLLLAAVPNSEGVYGLEAILN